MKYNPDAGDERWAELQDDDQLRQDAKRRLSLPASTIDKLPIATVERLLAVDAAAAANGR